VLSALAATALTLLAAEGPGDGRPAADASAPALAHYLRARVALARGGEQEAAREIDLAIAFDPSSAGLRAAAADLFLAIGNVGRASGEARRALDLGRNSDPEAQLRGHAVLGRVAASESRWQAAATELGAAARIAGAQAADGLVRPSLAAEDWFVLGVARESLRSWDGAAEAFSRVDGADGGLGALAALRQAYALSRARHHAEAIGVLERSRRPGDTRFAAMEGFVLGRAGRTEDAAAALRAEIAARGEDAADDAVRDLVDALASVLVDAGRPRDAIAELERGLAQRPGDRKLVLALAAALERAGDAEEALSRARPLLADDSDDVEALNFIGYLLADRGTGLDEAERLLVHAAGLAPGESAVLDSLGWLWFHKGETQRAIRTLERAEALAGGDATILDHLGDAYHAGGRRSDAKAAWRRAIAALDADPPAAAGEAERARLQRAALVRKLELLSPARAVR
jgi:tetratricopeptide (TPR) repeat protein